MPRTPRANEHDIFLSLLRDARIDRGVTQEALAGHIGFRQTDVSKVERGVRRLDILELRRWLTALGLSVADFVCDLDARLTNVETLHPAKRSKSRS